MDSACSTGAVNGPDGGLTKYLSDAGEAFLYRLMGVDNFNRWMECMNEGKFENPAHFIGWLLDVAQSARGTTMAAAGGEDVPAMALAAEAVNESRENVSNNHESNSCNAILANSTDSSSVLLEDCDITEDFLKTKIKEEIEDEEEEESEVTEIAGDTLQKLGNPFEEKEGENTLVAAEPVQSVNHFEDLADFESGKGAEDVSRGPTFVIRAPSLVATAMNDSSRMLQTLAKQSQVATAASFASPGTVARAPRGRPPNAQTSASSGKKPTTSRPQNNARMQVASRVRPIACRGNIPAATASQAQPSTNHFCQSCGLHFPLPLFLTHRCKKFNKPLCTICGKRFRHLSRHVMTTHSDNRPFQCPRCDYACKRKDNLTLHIRCKHKVDQIYTCKQCHHRTKDLHQLKQHLRSYHNVVSSYMNLGEIATMHLVPLP